VLYKPPSPKRRNFRLELLPFRIFRKLHPQKYFSAGQTAAFIKACREPRFISQGLELCSGRGD
jgi:hypothetical protein